MRRKLYDWAGALTQWLIDLRKRNRVATLERVRKSAPEYSNMTDEELEIWIYGDLLPRDPRARLDEREGKAEII